MNTLRHGNHRAARTGRRLYLLAAAPLLGAAIAALGWRHFRQLAAGHTDNTDVIAAVCFLWLAAALVMSHVHHDKKATRAQRAALDALRVTVIIPTFNEDPAFFASMLDSLSAQTRQPQNVIIVDDGSTQTDCRPVFYAWYEQRRPRGMRADYVLQTNGGKREAQATAVRRDFLADIYVTIDSDVRLEPDAIERGMIPFTDPKTMSVAGMLLGDNQRHSLLTRLVDVSFVAGFLNGRAQRSLVGSVTVNAGGFSLYRAEVIGDNLGYYLAQQVWGRKVTSGDDAMLTRFALLRGRTVFQRSAVAYTLHPVNLRHLTKQRIRWARSFWWGNVWMLRNFPARRIAWWMIAIDLINAVWMAPVIPLVFLVAPIKTGTAPLGALLVTTVLAYLQSLCSFLVPPPTEPRASQWATYALAPVSALFSLYLGWFLTYVGLFTLRKSGWGTRQIVEVGADTMATA